MPTLDWVGKEEATQKHKSVPYKFLREEHSYGDSSDDDASNMIIQADNLEALKALLPHYRGKVKCICTDPPYNKKKHFAHYRDNLKRSEWLNMMYPPLKLMHELLADDGSLWINIDDDECHYLKVMMDEIFGEGNFINSIIWQKKYAPQNDAKWFSDDHDFVLCYAKHKDTWRPNLLPRTDEQNARYENPDNDPRGVWMSDNLSVKTYDANCDYPITTPFGRVVNPPKSRCWRVSQKRLKELIEDNRIWFGKNGNNVPRLKRFISEVKDGITARTLWLRDNCLMICESCHSSVEIPKVDDNQEAKKEAKALNDQDVFSTPKPERLIQRVLILATKEGDLVLDAFLGSGATAAVAHKMNRRYIGIEQEDTAKTHACERLKKVIAGEQGGISKDMGWKGGGGFRFYTLTDKPIQTPVSAHFNFSTMNEN